MKNIAGPVQASSSSPNIEDSECHTLRVVWTPSTQTFAIYFDGEKRLTHRDNIIETVFDGNPEVYVGFTASTGRYQNLHFVCPPPIPNDSRHLVASKNETVTLHALPGYSKYKWSPSTGLNCDTCEAPQLLADVSRFYKVSVESPLGCFLEDSVFVEVVSNNASGSFCLEQACNATTISFPVKATETESHAILEIQNVNVNEQTANGITNISVKLIDSLQNGYVRTIYYDENYMASEHLATIGGFTVTVDTLLHNHELINEFYCDTIVLKNPERRIQRFSFAITSEHGITVSSRYPDNIITLPPLDTAHIVLCYKFQHMAVAKANLEIKDACNRIYTKELSKSFIPTSVGEQDEESRYMTVRNGSAHIHQNCDIQCFSVVGKEILSLHLSEGAVTKLPKGHIIVLIRDGHAFEQHLLYVE
jgi:hypothetical protein